MVLHPTNNPGQQQRQQKVCFLFFVFVLKLFFFCFNLYALLAPDPPPPAVPARRAPLNLNDALMASPRMPSIDNKMPKSFAVLLAEWQNLDLESFRNARLHEQKQAQAYGKRKYLYDTIASRSEAQGVTLQAMARSLDVERVYRKETMTAFFRFLHGGDDSIARRRSRPRARPAAAARVRPARPHPAHAAPRTARAPAAVVPPQGGWPPVRPAGPAITINGLPAAVAHAQERAANGAWESTGRTSGGRFGREE